MHIYVSSLRLLDVLMEVGMVQTRYLETSDVDKLFTQAFSDAVIYRGARCAVGGYTSVRVEIVV